MDIQKILHTTHRISKRKQMGFDKGMMHPVREWLWGLFFFFIVIAIGGALSTYTFLRYTDIVVKEANVSQTNVLYNQTLAQKALKTYQSRKDAFSILKNTENTNVPILFDISSSTPVSKPIQKEENSGATTTKNDQSVAEPQMVN